MSLFVLVVCSSCVAGAQTLGEALNATFLNWSTSGDVPWFVQTNVTHDGVAAVQAGAVTNGQLTVLSTTATGPGTLTYWGQVPDQGQVYLRFFVDKVRRDSITGSGWTIRTNYIGEGEHLLEWVFTNSTSQPATLNVARVDEVSFTAGPTGPVISTQPVSISQAPGLTTSFSVRATGTPPLHYQWHRDGLDLPGDSSSLSLTNITAKDAGGYSVTVSNGAGQMLSSTARLSLVCIASWAGPNDTPSWLTNAVAVAVGKEGHSLALLPDGTLTAWGYNSDGQGSVPAGLSNVVSIAAGSFHSLALKADGTVAAWGRNDYGETGVPADLTNAAAIAAYFHRSVALTSEGRVRIWGGPNYYGELNVPADLTNAVAISQGLAHSLVLCRDGRLRSWGDSYQGVTSIPDSATNIVAIAAGLGHSLALRNDGAVLAWGENFAGEGSVPVNLSNVVAVAGGVFSSFALLEDGRVVAWGGTQGIVPEGLTNVSALSAGGYHHLAIVGGPPVLHTTVSDLHADSTGFSVSFPSRSGKTYALEYAESLEPGAWASLPLVAGNGRQLTLKDTAPVSAARFYRVREW